MINRKIKIVADSSADVLNLGEVPFCSAPLKIIMVIESRNSVNLHYFDTKSLIWSQIFFENLSMSIAMNIGRIEFL